jgi:hypothetical protein
MDVPALGVVDIDSLLPSPATVPTAGQDVECINDVIKYFRSNEALFYYYTLKHYFIIIIK